MKKFLIILLSLAFALPVHATENYDLIYPHQEHYARIVKDLKWGLVNENLTEVLSPKWDYLGEAYESIRLVRSGDLTGFADLSGKQLIKPQFAQALNFSHGFAAVKNEEGKWGYIDTTGSLVIPYSYDEANSFSCGLALIRQNGLYGYINPKNEMAIVPVYQEAYPFFENRACVKIDEKYGYIDPEGTLVIPAEFDIAFDFAEGAAVVKAGQYGLIDSEGKFLISPGFSMLSSSVSGGYLQGKKNENWAIVDTTGRELTPFTYTYLGEFSEGFCPAATKEGYGFINSQFILEFSPVWEDVRPFSDGLAPVKKNGLWGYIDNLGQLVADYQFTEAGPFKEGYANVTSAEGVSLFIRPDEYGPTKPSSDNTTLEKNTLKLQIGHNFLTTSQGTLPLDAAPIIHKGHTLLPLRAVIEAMGGTVSWNASEQKITLQKDGHVIILQINKSTAFVNGRLTILEAVPLIENGYTLCPLRFAIEALDGTVTWEEATQSIYISY